MEGPVLDCSAAWTDSFLPGPEPGRCSRVDGATVGFSGPSAETESPELLGVSPALLLPSYPACYPVPAAAGSSAAQPGPIALPCQSGAVTATSDAAVTSKQEAWYESAHAPSAGCNNQTPVESGSRPPRLRCHSTPITLRWLRDNYELRDGVCIPRSVIYQHYTICCFENGIAPVNAASFGKIVRHQYPSLTTRRLGTRGKSRYYYYGLAVAPTSRFYHPAYSERHASVKLKKNYATTCSFEKERPSRQVALPEFPSLSRLAWQESGVQRATLHRFDTMYRAHCQRLLDLVTAGFFDEVRDTVVQFWDSMPQHVQALLHHDVAVQVVGTCDGLLYQTMAETLIPNELEASLELSFRFAEFGDQMRGWLVTILSQMPPQLQAVKLDCCYELQRVVQRLPQLARAQQAGWRLLKDQRDRAHLLAAWRAVDLYEVVQLTLSTVQHADFYCLTNAASEFEGILQTNSGVTSFLSFVDRLLARFFSNEGGGGSIVTDAGSVQHLEHCVRCVYLTWDTFCGEVLRKMPPTVAGSSLYSWLTEYLQYRLQLMCARQTATSRLSSLASAEGGTSGGSISSDNSYAGSDDSGTRRSPPSSQMMADLAGAGSDRSQLSRDVFTAVPAHTTDWQSLKQQHSERDAAIGCAQAADSFCAES